MGLSASNILFLKSVPYVGNQSVLKLLGQDKGNDYVSVADIIDFFLSTSKMKTIRLETLDFLKSREKCNKLYNEIERKIDIGYCSGVIPLGYNDDNFPTSLKIIKNKSGGNIAPTVIFYKGNVDCLSYSQNATVIGSRKPTERTKKAGEYIAKFLSDNDFNIVSGLAKGCDEIVHSVAVSRKTKTTAILPQGIDKIYPSTSTKLAESIVDTGGILLSELMIGERVTKYSLVERDRLQSAISDKTIVLQTAIDGGTMHAAMSALYNLKKLYVIDYKSINSEDAVFYSGFEHLLSNGAQKLNSNEMYNLVTMKENKKQESLFD
ncbi:DNA-processing protein DprA [Nissabacter sp. SGAir0207]|uniref:DNA-processing protein DprA n=1 Tax=Nissabacter sp. SGAir0207 TaxID=2126321 RepID=UPI0010CD02B8|nr:DNA-processing protein DprA [Nissabacter sp. SGAir0207]QCR38701.1 hypothetical protein C1N62_21410 [Nissabacter sp. SGAir0207]